MRDTLTITLGIVEGSGNPQKWWWRAVTPDGATAVHAMGPRILVLESLERFVALFREESAPSQEVGP